MSSIDEVIYNESIDNVLNNHLSLHFVTYCMSIVNNMFRTILKVDKSTKAQQTSSSSILLPCEHHENRQPWTKTSISFFKLKQLLDVNFWTAMVMVIGDLHRCWRVVADDRWSPMIGIGRWLVVTDDKWLLMIGGHR